MGISGANEDKKSVDMTAPVLTEGSPGAGPNCNTTFKVSFFVPFEYQPPNNPPPKPTSPLVFTETIPAQKVAVKSFGGMAKEQKMISEPLFWKKRSRKVRTLKKIL